MTHLHSDVLSALHRIAPDFADVAAAHDRSGDFPESNARKLHEAGILGLAAPCDLGGKEADLPTALAVVQSIARDDPSSALVLTMTWLTLRGFGERAEWPEHLRRRIVADVLDNGALVNSLRVEPDLGTPARGGLPATIARRDGDQWRISGRKIFSTGSTALTWMLVWARNDDDDPKVGSFLVHRSAPGIRIEPTWDHLGMRATVSHDVIFEDVPTPLDHALDLRPLAHVRSFSPEFAAWGSTLVPAIYDAVAQSARDWFVGWANNRVPSNLGAPVSSLYRFQEGIGSVDALLLSNRVLLQAAARGELGATELPLLKYLVTENAISVVERLVALSGNPGLSRSNPLERYHRDVLCGRIHTPQADVALGGSGRAAFSAAANKPVEPIGVAVP